MNKLYLVGYRLPPRDRENPSHVVEVDPDGIVVGHQYISPIGRDVHYKDQYGEWKTDGGWEGESFDRWLDAFFIMHQWDE